MADNVTIPASGTGDATPKVATDQLAGGEHVQYVKLMDGTLDGSGKVAGDAANGLDVDVTRLPALPTGANTIGKVDQGAAGAARWLVDASGVAVPITDNSGSLTVDAPVGTPVFARLSDGAAVLIGQKVMASSLPVAIASDQPALAAPTLTKGTQAATGYSVQELKDAGRVNIIWTAEFAATAVTEALLTLTESRDGAATTTFTSKVVTNGKRLRITSVQVAVESGGSTGTAIQRAILRLRFNTAGAVTTASPLQGVWQVGTNAATLKNSQSFAADFPDGIEFLGDGTKQIGVTLTNPDWVVTTSIPTTRVTITAFEY